MGFLELAPAPREREQSGCAWSAHSENHIERGDKPGSRLELVVTPSEVRLGDEAVDDEALLSAIGRAVARYDVTLQVQADSATPHARIVEIMDLARNAGVTHLAIATAPKPDPPAPSAPT